MPMRSCSIVAAWLIALAVLAAPLARAARAEGGSARRPLSLVDLAGASVELAPAPGERALVVHFWATWCPDCLRELPALERAASRCAASGVRFVTVNVGEEPGAIERFRAEHALALPLLRDPKGSEWRRFSRALPASVIWTPSERRTLAGPRDEADWVRTLGCESEGGGAR